MFCTYAWLSVKLETSKVDKEVEQQQQQQQNVKNEKESLGEIILEWKREKDKRELEFLLLAWSCCYVVSPFPDVWVLPY